MFLQMTLLGSKVSALSVVAKTQALTRFNYFQVFRTCVLAIDNQEILLYIQF